MTRVDTVAPDGVGQSVNNVFSAGHGQLIRRFRCPKRVGGKQTRTGAV